MKKTLATLIAISPIYGYYKLFWFLKNHGEIGALFFLYLIPAIIIIVSFFCAAFTWALETLSKERGE